LVALDSKPAGQSAVPDHCCNLRAGEKSAAGNVLDDGLKMPFHNRSFCEVQFSGFS
jgi:hypothetical protein